MARRRATYHAGGAPLRLLSYLGVSLVAGGTDVFGLYLVGEAQLAAGSR